MKRERPRVFAPPVIVTFEDQDQMGLEDAIRSSEQIRRLDAAIDELDREVRRTPTPSRYFAGLVRGG